MLMPISAAVSNRYDTARSARPVLRPQHDVAEAEHQQRG